MNFTSVYLRVLKSISALSTTLLIRINKKVPKMTIIIILPGHLPISSPQLSHWLSVNCAPVYPMGNQFNITVSVVLGGPRNWAPTHMQMANAMLLIHSQCHVQSPDVSLWGYIGLQEVRLLSLG